MDKALLAVGQGITNLGERDPRKGLHSDKHHPLFASFLKALQNEDGPADRAYPVNITIVRALFDALDTEHPIHGTLNKHVIDLILVGYFWLLRPVEYSDTGPREGRSQAFLLRHTYFTLESQTYSGCNVPLNDLKDPRRLESGTLEFDDQKNGVRGEMVGHRVNNDPLLCPVKALARLVLRLRSAHADADTPIYMHYNNHPSYRRWMPVKSQFITNALRHAARSLEHLTGIDHSKISARSLRPGGATALLCARVDTSVIQLLGRWKSDAMFRYLRVQAATHASNYAQSMLDHGSFTFVPDNFANHDLPVQAADMAAVLDHDELYLP